MASDSYSQKDPVIVFGPTGKVASVAASTAAEAGGKIILAMRDPNKTIKSLNDSSDQFVRARADLNDPESLTKAIKETNAKRAFVYLPPGARDGLKASLLAMRKAGVDFVVFLSSFSILVETSAELEAIPKDEIIPYVHAQVELNLREVFGDSYVALRPGNFATNTFSWKKGVQAGEVRMYRPELEFDYISSSDIGNVAGKILTSDKNVPQSIYLTGPKQVTQRDALADIAKALNKEVKLVEIDYEEALNTMKSNGMPPPIATYLAGKMKAGSYMNAAKKLLPEGSENIRRHSGREAETFDKWAQDNKEAFA